METGLLFVNRRIFLLISLLLLSVGGFAQSVTSQLQAADSLVHNGKNKAALQVYQKILQKDSVQKNALAHSAILILRKGEGQKKSKNAIRLYNQGKLLALKALKTDPDFTPAVYAYAFALYNLSMQEGVKDKIKGLKEVKDYIDRIFLLDSSYSKAWYLSGRWNMAFNKLNFAERAAVKLLFGGMPDAGVSQAITAYEQCKKTAPSFIRNYYFLALALHASGKDLEAITVLKKAIHLRPLLQEDPAYQQKCRNFIQSLK